MSTGISKKLKGPLEGYFRYRIGDWQVIYKIDETNRRETVMLIVHRSKAYR